MSIIEKLKGSRHDNFHIYTFGGSKRNKQMVSGK